MKKLIAVFEEDNFLKNISTQKLNKINFEVVVNNKKYKIKEYVFVSKILNLIQSYIKNYDILVIFSKFTAIYDEDIFKKFVLSSCLKNKLASLLISDITGIGLRHSPRLPFIDDNLIIINLKKMKEVNFLKRYKLSSSHFNNIAGRQAELISWLESMFLKDEFLNYYEKENSLNHYAENNWFSLFPYNINFNTGTIVCDVNYNNKISTLIDLNIGNKKIPTDKNFVKINSQYFLKKRYHTTQIVISIILNYFRSFMKNDFIKK